MNNKKTTKLCYDMLVRDEVFINGNQILDFTIGELSGERPLNHGLHCHSKLELSMVKSGTGVYQIGDRIYDIEPGDIMMINNIEPHGIVLENGQALTNLVIHFEPKFVWQEHNDFDHRYLQIFFDRNASFSHKLDNDNPATSRIRALLLQMEDEFKNKESEYELMVKVQLLNILVLLLRHYGYVKKDSNDVNIHEIKIINQVTEYIDLHFDQEIKLKELADIAHMTPTYFSTFFKKYNGLSPVDYIIRRRISRSMDYLLATDKTILEISGLCGFNNSANYNKMFKKISAMTPSVFRKTGDYRLKL